MYSVLISVIIDLSNTVAGVVPLCLGSTTGALCAVCLLIFGFDEGDSNLLIITHGSTRPEFIHRYSRVFWCIIHVCYTIDKEKT